MADSQTSRGEKSRAANLEFRNVQKRYPGQSKAAIEDLSFTVDAGEICVLVGPSGCGKTTAMRLVNRMIEMSDGDILLDGKSVKDSQPSDLRREIGYAIQSIGLFPHRTIADNIATVPRIMGWDKERIRDARRPAARADRAPARRSATAIRGSSRAASSSAWASRARWPPTLR